MTTLSDGETDLPLGTNVEVVVGSKLQEVRLLADDFLRDNVRERQNVLQPFQKTRWHLVALVLYLQELCGPALPPLLIHQ